MQKSIDRAIALLKTPKEYEKYISIKLSPPSGCCCSDCWPTAWQRINSAIAPCGPIKHEGDALIKVSGDRFVLEQHESGPEIIIYLALATASATLVKSIIDLITTVIKSLSSGDRKQPPRIKISKRIIIKGKIQEEKLIEVDIPMSKDMQRQLEETVAESLNCHPKK